MLVRASISRGRFCTKNDAPSWTSPRAKNKRNLVRIKIRLLTIQICYSLCKLTTLHNGRAFATSRILWIIAFFGWYVRFWITITIGRIPHRHFAVWNSFTLFDTFLKTTGFTKASPDIISWIITTNFNCKPIWFTFRTYI